MKRIAVLALALALAAGAVHAQSGGSRLKKIAGAKTITIAYRADATPFSFSDAPPRTLPMARVTP